MSEQYEEQNVDSSGQDQTEGGVGGEGGGEENNEADMIFAPEASKPGRNAGMLMIAFVMIGVGVIYFMRARTGGPQIVNGDAVKAETSIKEFIRDGNQLINMKHLLESTEKVVKQWDVDKNAQPDKELVFNPFKYVSPNDKGPSMDPNAKDKAQAKAQVKFVEGLNNLRVQYLMVSAFAKTAMINNKLVQEGQEVEGFTVQKITPSEVTFRKTVDGYTFEAPKKTQKDLQ